MDKTLRTELLQKHPELQSQQHWEAISEQTAKTYASREEIKILNPYNSYRPSGTRTAAVSDIATYYPLFLKVKKMFESDDTDTFQFCYEKYGYLSSISLSRYDILKTLERLIPLESTNENGPHLSYAFEQLLELASPERVIKQEQGKTFEIEIEGKQHSFPADEFVRLITLPDDEFKKAVEGFDEAQHGCSFAEYVYALNQYVSTNDIFSKAYYTDAQVSRFQDLYQNRIVDCQAINEMTKTKNNYLEQTQVSDELRQAVVSNMPADYNDLQKAQYIYLKLCQTLTYNAEYFAVDKRGPKVKPHLNINYVQKITPDNCEAVCYEFAVIYGKLLSEYTNATHDLVFQNSYFGSGKYSNNDHTYIQFRSGKFLVTADSVRGIFTSDLTSQKLDRPILGLKCDNQNPDTVREFQQSLQGVIEDINVETFRKSRGDMASSFEDALREFRDITADESVYLDPQAKVDFIIQQIGDANLRGIDAFCYLLQLRKLTFSKPEQDTNMYVNIVREEPKNPGDPILSTGIITLSTNYKDPYAEKTYLVFRPAQGIIQPQPQGPEQPIDNFISQTYSPDSYDLTYSYVPAVPKPEVEEISPEELVDCFTSKKFSYISKEDFPVPGINIPVTREFMINEYVAET